VYRLLRVLEDGKVTRVINFGVDGMGMIQFAAMVRHHVNFVSDDILRRLRYLSVFVHPKVPDESIRIYVKTNYLDGMNWFGLCPELLTATAGPLWGKRCMLPLDAKEVLAAGPAFHFTKRKDALIPA
jgi:hypothetical protein